MEKSPHAHVRDYMIRDVPTIPLGTTLESMIHRMIKAHEHWLVIADASGGIAGVVSSLDILKYIVPDYLETDTHIVHFAAQDAFADRVRKLQKEPVEKFMTKHVQTVRESETLMTAAALMVDFKVHRLPVLNAEGKLAGYIGQTALANAMSDVFFR